MADGALAEKLRRAEAESLRDARLARANDYADKVWDRYLAENKKRRER